MRDSLDYCCCLLLLLTSPINIFNIFSMPQGVVLKCCLIVIWHQHKDDKPIMDWQRALISDVSTQTDQISTNYFHNINHMRHLDSSTARGHMIVPTLPGVEECFIYLKKKNSVTFTMKNSTGSINLTSNNFTLEAGMAAMITRGRSPKTLKLYL